jgi:hypothetical protein
MAAALRATRRLGLAMPLCALAIAVAGCSSMQDLAGLQRPGYQPDGSYVMSAQEQGAGCRELQERSLGLQEQMQQLSVSALQQMQQLPNTVVSAWGRLVGSPEKGVPAIAEYNEARAESAALNATITHKGCSPIETAAIRH